MLTDQSIGGIEDWLPTVLFLAIAAASYVIIRRQWPERAVRWLQAATCGLLGRLDERHVWVDRVLAVNPDDTVSSMRLYYGVFMKKPGCLEALLDGLRKVGLPE